MNDDFSELENMVYSGRGITIGMTLEGKPFIGYTLTGRSPSSQARKLVYNPVLKSISIEVTDENILNTGNPALLVYTAIEFIDDSHKKIIASNGKQTNVIRQMAYSDDSLSPLNLLIAAHSRDSIENGINVTTYEPDAPNFTPRISGCVSITDKDIREAGFYMVQKIANSDRPNPSLMPCMLRAGEASMLTTYDGGNENPLLPFSHGRLLSASVGSTSANDICESLYAAIGPKGDHNYRVAAAVMIWAGKKTMDHAIINRADRGS